MGRDYDFVVIGGGAGGMGAARAGVRRGARTVLVQDGPIGGDCTFTGCIPSKALIAAAGRRESFADAMANVHRAVAAIAATEDDAVFAHEGIDVVHGRARFVSPTEIEVDGRRISGRRFVIATGASPAVPPIPGLRELEHLTSDNVFDLTAQPASLAMLGGGNIGCELAQAFARLGTRVTLIEGMARLLVREEPEASAAVADALRADGVDVRLGRKVTAVTATAGGARIDVDGGESFEAARVLVAVGRRPVTDGLDLDVAGIEVDERGFVRTDDTMATSARHIWSVGDVAGKLQLTHAADEMGRIAAGNALSRRPGHRRFRAHWTPWATFTDPEVGRVGMTEAESVEHGGRVAFLPMTEVDRAVAEGDTRGFVKLIAGPRRIGRNLAGGRLLGATVVARRGGDLVHEPALALRSGMYTARLAATVHAYPSWSLSIQKAAAQFFLDVEGRQARPAQAE